jgi:hypothetical protein
MPYKQWHLGAITNYGTGTKSVDITLSKEMFCALNIQMYSFQCPKGNAICHKKETKGKVNSNGHHKKDI